MGSTPCSSIGLNYELIESNAWTWRDTGAYLGHPGHTRVRTGVPVAIVRDGQIL